MFLKSLFSRKKNKDYPVKIEDKNKLLYKKIEDAIIKCEKDRVEALKDTDKIKRWSKDIITEIFEVPEKYWYEEFKNYGKIKSEAVNSKIGEAVIHKCDEVIKGYREQIEIRESKILLSEALHKKYEQTKKRLDDTVKQIEKLKKEEHEIQMLEIHSNRISKMNTASDSELENVYENADKLIFVDTDIKNIEDDFEIKKEYLTQLDIISQKYKTDNSLESNELYKQEIQNLLKKVNDNIS